MGSERLCELSTYDIIHPDSTHNTPQSFTHKFMITIKDTSCALISNLVWGNVYKVKVITVLFIWRMFWRLSRKSSKVEINAQV